MEPDWATGGAASPDGTTAADDVSKPSPAEHDDGAWPVLSNLELDVCLAADPQQGDDDRVSR
jgi:hypothetical protein